MRGDDAAYGQRSAGTRPSADDPLAELARLIGQEDPFAEFFRENESPQNAPAAPQRAARPAAPQPRQTQHDEPVRPEPSRRGTGSFSQLAAEVYAEPIPRQGDPRQGDPRQPDPRGRGEHHEIQDGARAYARSQREAEAPRPVDRAARPSDLAVEAIAEALGQPLAPAPRPAEPRSASTSRTQPAAPARAPQTREAYSREAYARDPYSRDAQDPRDAQDLRDAQGRSAPASIPGFDDPAPRPAARPEPQSRGGFTLDDDAYDYGRTAVERDGYDADASDEGEGYDDYDGYEEERPARGRGRLMLVGALLAGVALLGAAGYFGLRALSGGNMVVASGGQPPIIKADHGPSKVAPAQPAGGDQSADGQKLIYDRVGGDPSGNEKVVSSQEEPVDPSQAAQPQSAAPRVILPPTGGPAPSPSAPAPLGAMPSVNAPQAQPGSGAPNPASTEPKRVRTLTVRADGTVVDSSPAPAPQVPAAPVPAAPAPAAPAPANAVGAPMQMSAYAPDDAAPSTPMPANVPLPPTRVAAVPAPSAAAPSSASADAGGYFVQVAAQRTQAEAQSAWRATQGKYPGILGNYSANIRRADLGDRGIYYRAQVGPFNSKDQANELCQSLRAQGGDCMVQRN